MTNLNEIHAPSGIERGDVEHQEETAHPPALTTVHGEGELVMLHADADQERLDRAANTAAIVGIQRGLQGMYDGTSQDAEDAFTSLERKLGIGEHA